MRMTILLLGSLLLAGCTSTSSTVYDDARTTPKPVGYQVQLLDASNISRPYRTIGIAEANAGRLRPHSETIRKLKDEARRMGGDAIINVQRGGGAGMIMPAGNMYVYGNAREIWSATVIVWTD
ncbi:MAG TPA: hypothetical protein PKE55_08970 [Kiritimatiellia bacterium]|nr:hypothetical protein [Kiritimatiellia bacterium]